MLRIVHDAEPGRQIRSLDLDELCRLAAREMLALALEADDLLTKANTSAVALDGPISYAGHISPCECQAKV